MKVKELIEKLQKLDPEKSISCYSADEGLRTDESPVQTFEIDKVSVVEAECIRLNGGSGKPWLKFGRTENSSTFFLLKITSDI